MSVDFLLFLIWVAPITLAFPICWKFELPRLKARGGVRIIDIVFLVCMFVPLIGCAAPVLLIAEHGRKIVWKL